MTALNPKEIREAMIIMDIQLLEEEYQKKNITFEEFQQYVKEALEEKLLYKFPKEDKPKTTPPELPYKPHGIDHQDITLERAKQLGDVLLDTGYGIHAGLQLLIKEGDPDVHTPYSCLSISQRFKELKIKRCDHCLQWVRAGIDPERPWR